MAEVIGVPVGGVPDGPVGRGAIRRPFLLFFVLAALLALLTLVVVMGYYVATRQPITELPVVEPVARVVPPRKLFSFIGVTRPLGIAVSPDGQRIFVTEGGGERLIKAFDRDGRPVGQVAPPNTKPGTRKPGFVAIDGRGRLYVSDQVRQGIDMYSPTLQWEGVYSSPAIQALGGWLPSGLAFGPDGRLYVAEVGRQDHGVVVIAPDGSLVSVVDRSKGVPGGLNYPVQAVADAEGRIYVSDGLTSRLLVYGPRGVATAGSLGDEALGLPLGLAISGQKLFVADASQHRIVVFAVGDRPQYLHAFGDSEDADGLSYPNAVAVDRMGRIYVADRANDRVQVWTY